MPAVVEPTDLAEAVQRIVAALHPLQVRLFGSHAYGQPHADSDVDLFAIVPDSAEPSFRQEMEAYKALAGLRLPVEVHVCNESEFARRSQAKASLERVVAEKGKVVYVA